MDKNKAREAREHALEQNDELLKNFQREFEEQIVNSEPAEGKTRIQILEELTHKLVLSIKEENLKYVSSMIGSLDEDDIIQLKKENS